MHSHDFVIVTLQLACMLGCALACGQLMSRLGQPAVLGEMFGGILLGPTVLGMLWPDAFAWLFPAGGTADTVRNGVIKLGMIFFLFLIGLEINFADIRRHGWSALLIGLAGTLVPMACGVAVVYLLPGLWAIERPSQRLAYALFIGVCMANTANPVLARILLDLGLLRKNFGAVLLTATVVDDLVAWGTLMLVIGQFKTQEIALPGSSAAAAMLFAIVCLVGVLLVGRHIGVPLVRRSSAWLNGSAGPIAVISLMVLAAAALSETLGVHAFLGPFVLGIALASTSEESKPAYEVIRNFSLGFFVPIYFVSMGLTANFVTDFQAVLVAVLLFTACISKTLSAYAGARLSGIDNRTSWAIGFGMNARGAVGIILAGIGLENGVIDHPTYVALVIMCLVTSLMAGPLMRMFLAPAQAVSSAPAESVVA
jgi:Kef-type K+ transport system membrane component KefB